MSTREENKQAKTTYASAVNCRSQKKNGLFNFRYSGDIAPI